VVQGWGGDGAGYTWGNDGHGIHVDHNKFVWVGDNVETGGHIFKFTRDGKFVMRIGKPGTPGGSNDTEHLGQPADMVVDRETNELFVADSYGNKRVIVFDAATGRLGHQLGEFYNLHFIGIDSKGNVYSAEVQGMRMQKFRNVGGL
jgi:DNA-binding beta-propeller fold protein YncE